MKTYANLALMLIAALIMVGLFFAGDRHGRSVERLKGYNTMVAAVNKAIDEERRQQKEIDDATDEYINDLLNINDNLTADLERVRARAARMSEAARAKCKGATGAELSREDAEFLTREAARADELRAALSLCYDYADTVVKQ